MSRREDYEECPERVYKDIGSAFMMGSIGGSIWHFIAGYRNRPRGNTRFKVKWKFIHKRIITRAPKLGAGFAAWMGLYSFFECFLSTMKDGSSAWTSIGAGGLTGMILQSRKGTTKMARGFWFGCALMRV